MAAASLSEHLSTSSIWSLAYASGSLVVFSSRPRLFQDVFLPRYDRRTFVEASGPSSSHAVFEDLTGLVARGILPSLLEKLSKVQTEVSLRLVSLVRRPGLDRKS